VPAISPTLQQEASPKVDFAELTAHPEQYKGRLVILGGLVMSVQPWQKGSLLEADQREMDERLYPISAASGGTFLVESNKWLNPTWYIPKSKVVVAGVVEGARNGVLLLKGRQITFIEPLPGKNTIIPYPGRGIRRSWSSGTRRPIGTPTLTEDAAKGFWATERQSRKYLQPKPKHQRKACISTAMNSDSYV
jgi:hypothetical protein